MKVFTPQQKQIAKTDTSFQNEPDAFERDTIGLGKHGLINGAGLNYNFGNIPVYNQNPLAIQTKLTVNTPGDKYEQEADAVAEKIVKTPNIRPLLNTHSQLAVQRKCAACEKEEEEEKPIQRKCAACQKQEKPIQRMTIQRKCAECEKKEKEEGLQRKESDHTQTPSYSKVHQTLRSAGQSLDKHSLSFMESRFGQSFGHVRIHTDSLAADSARSVNARAYTVGNNIVFGQGEFTPHTTTGKQLLAHELTHTIQQSPAGGSKLQTRLNIGEINTPEEIEANQAAKQITHGAVKPVTQINPAPMLRRQALPDADVSKSEPDFTSKQQRGGQPRAVSIDAGKRGEDQVKVAVTRYMCTCRSRNVSKSHATGQILPSPGFTLEFCNGRITAKLVGDVTPNSLTTGKATLTGTVNVAPNTPGGLGGNLTVKGTAQNTGSEPQVSGEADVRIGKGDVQGGAGATITKGLDTGKQQVDLNLGVDVDKFRITGGVNDVTGKNPAPTITFGGNLPGQDVSKETCRECRCPIVYDCAEDIPPRDYEESHDIDVSETSPLRYYFSLDTANDTTESTLKAQSTQMLDEVARRVKAGAKIDSVTGYASPEDNQDKPVPNMQLSFKRAKRLRELLVPKVGADVQLPQPEAGGELLGRTATIAPDSGLADAMLDAGFKGPEDVSAFLIGTDIPNQQLANQFLALLQSKKLQSPASRLSLFGIDEGSPAAPRLLSAIDKFIASKGKGRRPWENMFGFLRFATVKLVETHKETVKDSKRTTGSLTKMNDAACKPYSKQAEDAGLFGPYEPEPKTDSTCEDGRSNSDKMSEKCDYN